MTYTIPCLSFSSYEMSKTNSPSSFSSLLRKVVRGLTMYDEGLTVPFYKM